MHTTAPPALPYRACAPTDPFISRYDSDTDNDKGHDNYLDCIVAPAPAPILHRPRSRSKAKSPSSTCSAAAAAAAAASAAATAAEVMRLPCVSFSPYETVYKFDQCRGRKQSLPNMSGSFSSQGRLVKPHGHHNDSDHGTTKPKPRLSLSSLIPSGKLLRRLSNLPAEPSSAPAHGHSSRHPRTPRSPISIANTVVHSIEIRSVPAHVPVATAARARAGARAPLGPLDENGDAAAASAEEEDGDPFSDSPRTLCEEFPSALQAGDKAVYVRPGEQSSDVLLGSARPAPSPPSPIESQRVWLCSPPRRQLTPVSGRNNTPPPPFSSVAPTSERSLDVAATTATPTAGYDTAPVPVYTDEPGSICTESAPTTPCAQYSYSPTAGREQDHRFVLGPPVRCRPVVTRAMSTGRLAREFDEDGGVVCLSAHTERVLPAATSVPVNGGRVWARRADAGVPRVRRMGTVPSAWRQL